MNIESQQPQRYQAKQHTKDSHFASFKYKKVKIDGNTASTIKNKNAFIYNSGKLFKSFHEKTIKAHEEHTEKKTTKTVYSNYYTNAFQKKEANAHEEYGETKKTTANSPTVPVGTETLNISTTASPLASSTEKQTLPGNSDQYIQWVIFNDTLNSHKLGDSLPFLGERQQKELAGILDNLSEHYPDDTPTLHLVVDIYQENLLNGRQKKDLKNFFDSLASRYPKLQIIYYADLESNLTHNKVLCDLKSYFHKVNTNGTRQKLEILMRVSKALDDNWDLDDALEKDIDTIWTNLVSRNPWMNKIFEDNGIKKSFKPGTLAQKRDSIFNELKRQTDQLNQEKMIQVEFLTKTLPLTGSQKAVFVDLQRSIVLFNSDKLARSNGKLIYRDFDTKMTSRLPDIQLNHGEILGVEDIVVFPGYDLAIGTIVENAVMGVTRHENTHLENIIKGVNSTIDSLNVDHPIQKDIGFTNNYNAIYDQLDAPLVSHKKSTFQHYKAGSLKS